LFGKRRTVEFETEVKGFVDGKGAAKKLMTGAER
jgi:hypothetical protein